MAGAGGLKVLWLIWFAKPASNRALFKAIRRRRPRKIMLLGLGDLDRALQIISLAQRYHPQDGIEFVATDPFETRGTDLPSLKLKEAHRVLRATEARVTLVPGNPSEALPRSANGVRGVDLVLIGGEQDDASLGGAWFYLPRTLAADGLVLRESAATEGTLFAPIEVPELQRRAAAATPRRRAA